MYAVIEDSGTQFKVSQGDTIEIDLRDVAEDQKTIEFDRVLMVGGVDEPKVGTPLVEGAKVVAEIAGPLAGPKIDVVKFRRRQGYHLKQGHRQKYLQVKITDIQA